MTTYLTTRKDQKLQLNGTLLTGDTYPLRDYIKAYLDGRWNANAKGWTVDLEKVEKILRGNSIGLRIDDNPQPKISAMMTDNRPCRYCGTYCYGDCRAN